MAVPFMSPEVRLDGRKHQVVVGKKEAGGSRGVVIAKTEVRASAVGDIRAESA
jgi:hypothetical protein